MSETTTEPVHPAEQVPDPKRSASAKKSAATRKANAAKKLKAQKSAAKQAKDDEVKRQKHEDGRPARLEADAKKHADEDKKHPLYGKYKCYVPEEQTSADHNFTIDIEHEGVLHRFAAVEKPYRPKDAQILLDQHLLMIEKQSKGTIIRTEGVGGAGVE